MQLYLFTLVVLIPALVQARECPGVTVMKQINKPFNGQWYIYEAATIGNSLRSGKCGLVDPNPACKCHSFYIMHPDENIPSSYVARAEAYYQNSRTAESADYRMKKYRTEKFVYYGKIDKTKVSINIIDTDDYRTWAAFVICSKDTTVYLAATKLRRPDEKTVTAVKNAFRRHARQDVRWRMIDHYQCGQH